MKNQNFEEQIKNAANEGTHPPRELLWDRIELKVRNKRNNSRLIKKNAILSILSIAACLMLLVIFTQSKSNLLKNTNSTLAYQSYQLDELAYKTSSETVRKLHKLKKAYDSQNLLIKTKNKDLKISIN